MSLVATRYALAFVVASIAGVVLTLGGAAPWVPLVVVGGYGIVALFLHALDRGASPPAVVDSPYFLGFILTLASLYHAFDQMHPEANGSFAPGPFIAGAAAALIPTALGLLLRQTAIVFSDVALSATEDAAQLGADAARQNQERTNELIGRLLTQQSETHALLSRLTTALDGSLHRDEMILTKVIEAFVGEIEELRDDALIGDIRAVHAEMVGAMRTFVQGRDKVLELDAADRAQWKKHIQAFGTALSKIEAQTDAASERLGDTLASMSTTLDSGATAFARAAEVAKDGSLTFAKQTHLLSASVAGFTAVTSTQATTVAASQAQLGIVLESVESSLRQVHESHQSLDHAISETQRLPDAIGQVVESLRSTGQQFDDASRALFEPLRRDIEAIDQIVSDLVLVLRDRMSELEKVTATR